MVFYEGERRCRTQSYFYRQIYSYKYKALQWEICDFYSDMEAERRKYGANPSLNSHRRYGDCRIPSELLWKQQTAAMELQEYLPEEKRGNLFVYRRVLHYKKGGTSRPGRIQTVFQSVVEYHFKRICKQYNIWDEGGKIYNLTFHQFRHNGITDRLEVGFTLEQIADMKGHHGTL